jgi:hypothetical protein
MPHLYLSLMSCRYLLQDQSSAGRCVVCAVEAAWRQYLYFCTNKESKLIF